MRQEPPPEPTTSGGVVKPKDCAILFGIPITDAEYTEQLRHPAPRDFVRRACKNRLWFHNQVELFASRMIPEFERLGVVVIRGAKLESLREVLSSSHRIVIFFSHWQDEPALIEFFDGMATPNDVSAVIPRTFGGIIDWCICNPALLALLHYQNNSHLRFWRNQRLTPALWLEFYFQLFHLLHNNSYSYLEAYGKAITLIKKQI